MTSKKVKISHYSEEQFTKEMIKAIIEHPYFGKGI